MTAPAVEAPPPALDTGALSESTRGTASGASLSGLPASGDVETVVEVVEDVDDVEVVVVVDVVEGGVLGLVVVEGCTVTFIVANTFRPLCLAPPQTYSSTSHLQHDTLTTGLSSTTVLYYWESGNINECTKREMCIWIFLFRFLWNFSV